MLNSLLMAKKVLHLMAGIMLRDSRRNTLLWTHWPNGEFCLVFCGVFHIAVGLVADVFLVEWKLDQYLGCGEDTPDHIDGIASVADPAEEALWCSGPSLGVGVV